MPATGVRCHEAAPLVNHPRRRYYGYLTQAFDARRPMNQLQYLLNDACAGDRRKPQRVTLRLAIFSCALSHCMFITVGCGSAAQDGETPIAQPAVPPVVSSTPTSPPVEGVTPRNTSNVAVPTAEQIERWTPAPFEPVQLLAIREWEKTSFTRHLASTRDGKHFIAAGSRVLFWSVTDEEPEHVFLELTPADQDRAILSLDVSLDGRWFAVGDSTGTVRIWSLDDRKEIVAKRLGSTGIQCLAISPDAREIATITYDNEVTTWSADTLEQQNKFKVDTNGLERIAYVAPKMLAAAGESTSLWNTSTGALVQALSPGRYRFALGRSPDGTRFIFGGDDSLHVWHIAESRQEAEIAQGVSGTELLAFSPDGKSLATTNGRSVQLWNLAERRVVQVINSFGWPIVGVRWLPETNLLVVASDSGCNRVWGTHSQGATLGLKPLHAPVAMPDAASKAPATQAQLEQVIDLRTIPRLPDSEPSVLGQSNFSCLAAVTPDEAKSFYRYMLEKLGWTAAETPSVNPAAMEFRKDGFRISVHCYDAGGSKTNVMLHHEGNYDLRWTPKFDAAPVEPVYEAENAVSYRTKADLVQIETTLLRKLHAAGWTPYIRLHSSHSESPDQRDLTFLRNGTTLRVSIGRFPADPASYVIQYSLFFNNASLPVPPDSGFVEFDGSMEPARGNDGVDARSSPRLLRQRAHDSRLAHPQTGSIAQGGPLLAILHPRPVRLDRRADEVARRSDVGPRGGCSRLAVGAVAGEGAASGRDRWRGFGGGGLPRFERFAVRRVRRQRQEYRNSGRGRDAGRCCRAIQQIACRPGLDVGSGRDSCGGLYNADVQQRVQGDHAEARLQNGKAVVNFQGDGLLWNKGLPTGKQVVSYQSWLRQNKHPAGLELLDRYETEMRAINSPQATTSPTGE